MKGKDRMLGQTPPWKVKPGSPEMMRADVNGWRESVGLSHIKSGREYQREQQKKFNDALWNSTWSTPAVVWTPRIVDVPKRVAATAQMPMSAWPGQYEAKREPAKPVDWRKGLKWTGYAFMVWGGAVLFSPIPGSGAVILGLGALMIWPARRTARKEREELERLWGFKVPPMPKAPGPLKRWRERAKNKRDEAHKAAIAQTRWRLKGLQESASSRGYFLRGPDVTWRTAAGATRTRTEAFSSFGQFAAKPSAGGRGWQPKALGIDAWPIALSVQVGRLLT